MARIRSIKPEFWTDFRLAKDLPRDVRLFYIALWNEADDEGRFQAHPRRVLGACFPYDDDLSAEDIKGWLQLLEESGRLVLYTIDDEPYAELTKFGPHQKINRPTPSRLPAPPESAPAAGEDGSRTTHGELNESSSPRARTPELELGARNRDLELDPPGVAQAREALTDSDVEPAGEVEQLPDEPSAALALVPGDFGERVIPLRPAGDEAVPFGALDWEGRTSGSVVLREWINLQPTKPSQSDRDRFGRVCRQLADEHTVGELAMAFIGMGCIWPWAPRPVGEGRTWTPEDLRRDFVKTIPAAMQHPQLKSARFQQEFEAAVAGGAW